MSFRENLLYLRATHDLTQEQLAEQLGVSRQSVTKWESDKSYPEMDKLIKMSQLFDCTLDELVQGDLTGRMACDAAADAATPSAASSEDVETTQPSEPRACIDAAGTHEAANATEPATSAGSAATTQPGNPPEPAICAEDEFGYEDHVKSFADRISSGVFCIIFGTALSIIFFTLGDANASPLLFPENLAAALGTLFVLIGVALGLMMIVPAGLARADFVRKHPHLPDFYTEEKRADIRRSFTYELVGGIVFVFVGVVVMILFADGPFEELIGVPLMLACIAIGARAIVHGSIIFGFSNISNYNAAAAEMLSVEEIARAPLTPEQRKEMLSKNSTDKRIGALCGAIMMIATIAGLVMLFVPGYQQPFFWLAWPIGGLLCGLTATLMKGFAKES